MKEILPSADPRSSEYQDYQERPVVERQIKCMDCNSWVNIDHDCLPAEITPEMVKIHNMAQQLAGCCNDGQFVLAMTLNKILRGSL